jgi:cytochrome c-type biogenesis protein CcmF
MLEIVPRRGSNFVEDAVRFEISGDGIPVHVLEPSKRIYTTRNMPTTEAAIETYYVSQLYISPGEINPDGSVTIRIWWKPFVTLIWLGTVAMVLAGVLSLSDRRLRVGAPQPSRARAREAGANA